MTHYTHGQDQSERARRLIDRWSGAVQFDNPVGSAAVPHSTVPATTADMVNGAPECAHECGREPDEPGRERHPPTGGEPRRGASGAAGIRRIPGREVSDARQRGGDCARRPSPMVADREGHRAAGGSLGIPVRQRHARAARLPIRHPGRAGARLRRCDCVRDRRAGRRHPRPAAGRSGRGRCCMVGGDLHGRSTAPRPLRRPVAGEGSGARLAVP
jgi:hypothetical protein